MESPSQAYPTTASRDPFEDHNPSELHSVKVELDQEQVDSIIRSKRKVRDPKACYACHRRKVKCDRKLPCDSCIKRDHPELCSYERPTKKRKLAFAGAGDDGVSEDQEGYPNTVTISKEQWDSMTHELAVLRENVARSQSHPAEHGADHFEDQYQSTGPTSRDEAEREGVHATSNQMGTAHLGSRSVLAYMMGLGRSQSSQDAARSLLEEEILPKLGLDNESATYPFVDLWSKESSLQDVSGLCKAIPNDQLCREFFLSYREVSGIIYPVVADINAFDREINNMLDNRRVTWEGQLDPNRPYGVSFGWLALCFAVFASGAQCTRHPAKQRELTSQVFVCCSYQALRMANFLTHPSLVTIQATCIIANVLSYNMNPGVAYIFLGMTLRMAYSMGLQIDSQSFSEEERYQRARTWWMLAWQDSHFSVSYDRPSSSVLCHPPFPYAPAKLEASRTYGEVMFGIIGMTQEIVRERMLHPKTTMTWSKIYYYKEEVQRIVSSGSLHLRDRSYCYVMTQHLERLALKLHSNYIISELCRPALKESAEGRSPTPITSPTTAHRKASHQSNPSTPSDPTLPLQLRSDCIIALQNSVEAYTELRGPNQFAARSWIGIQRALSAAFLLGTIPETLHDPRSLALLRDLQHHIFQHTMGDDTGFNDLGSNGQDSPNQRRSSATGPPIAESPHWARSMTKSLNALGKLNAALAARPAMSTSIPQVSTHTSMYKPSTLGAGMNHLLNQAPPPPQQSQYPPITNLKLEPYSPSLTHAVNNGTMQSSGGGGIGPITPDSTGSSSDWHFGNIIERASEYVQPALWG